MRIAAVVVTYNRIDLLRKCIDCLRLNKPLDSIIVVDNGSSDGTPEWLSSQTDLKVLRQGNVGGSGGFHTGIDFALKDEADFIWCMDDDVFPRPNCLEELLKEASDKSIGILAPRRLIEGKIYTNDFLRFDLSNPFASLHSGKLRKMRVSEPTDIAGTAFEGPLIRREVVEIIGLPNKDLFIFCDDTDYCLRAKMAGFRIRYVPKALMDKHKFFSNDSWTERNIKKKWKRYYQVRNYSYLNHHYANNLAAKYVRGLLTAGGYIITAILTFPFSKAWSIKDVKRLWRAYLDGINERLGIMNNL